MRFRGPLVLAAAAAVVLAPAALPAATQLVGDGRAGLLDQPRGRERLDRDAARPRHVRDRRPRPLPGPQLPPHRPGRERDDPGGRGGHVQLDGDVRDRPLHARLRPARDPDDQALRRGNTAAADRAEASGHPAEAACDGRPEEHNRAPERNGRRDQDLEGADVLDQRPRPLEAAQLPPRRQGRQPQVGPGRHGHADLDGEALGGRPPLLLGPRARARSKARSGSSPSPSPAGGSA